MKRAYLTAIFILIIAVPYKILATEKSRITILATGGTIAGTAESASQASYIPGVISIDEIIASVPGLNNVAELNGIQVCNISSQNITPHIWLKLHTIIDSLFSNNLSDGIVITHGTDTMEETAYFLNLTVKHKRPIVLTGSMRPSSSLSADGPFNLFNAVSLASSTEASGKGVMVIMNDIILSADDVTKSHTVNTNAFSCPNFGPLGYMRDGKALFYRKVETKHTFNSEFNISKNTKLPQVEIAYSYAFSSGLLIKALINSGVEGIVIAGVGHGNYNREYAAEMERGYGKGIRFVRSARVFRGGVDKAAEEYEPKHPVSGIKSPQKARILLMLALTKSNDSNEIQRLFDQY
ncbi:MAG: asparaginase [Bacteroidales bacterium]|nr:asparaginase [Bacteroidales bacterium]